MVFNLWLDYINEEVAVQAAMLADASCEGLQFIRKLDDEDTDLSEVICALADYLLRLETLFVHEQCVHVTGYTHFMLQRLQTPLHWNTGSTHPRWWVEQLELGIRTVSSNGACNE